MQISDGLELTMIKTGSSGHIPVIAVETEKRDLELLREFGFDTSREELGVFPASLTVTEIRQVAACVEQGKLRHNRPMPRKHQTTI